ncbi:MAG: hypothetical protein V1896_02160 [Candidatus Zambryskibacteria bacterium]
MAKTIIDWCGDWGETVPIIEKAVEDGEILEINLPLGEWEKLRNSRRELTSRLSELAASRIQFLYFPNGRYALFIGNGVFR